MSISTTSSICAIALMISVASGADRVRAESQQNDKDIKLSGCLVRGEDGGYLLTNSPSEPAWQRSADPTVAPGAVGTTGNFATIFYWLKDHDDLKEHVGHLVEVGEVTMVHIVPGPARFDRNTSRHDHLVCETCHTIRDVPAGPRPTVPKQARGGFLVMYFKPPPAPHKPKLAQAPSSALNPQSR